MNEIKEATTMNMSSIKETNKKIRINTSKENWPNTNTNGFKIFSASRIRSALVYWLLICTIFYGICFVDLTRALSEEGTTPRTPLSLDQIEKNFNSNYKKDRIVGQQETTSSPLNKQTTITSNKEDRLTKQIRRQGRQYMDGITNIGASSASSNDANNYATLAGDGTSPTPSSYSLMNQLPAMAMNLANYAATGGAGLQNSYAAAYGANGPDMPPANYLQQQHHQYQQQPYYHPSPVEHSLLSAPPIGRAYSSGHYYPVSAPPPTGVLGASPFPLLSKGFDVTEIICTAIAIAIGAVIVGAPFVLIYLFVMNYTNGGGGLFNGLGPAANGGSMNGGGGAISITGPNTSQQNNGRKKRHASASYQEGHNRPPAAGSRSRTLKELINDEQLGQTFRLFVSSLSKYQM